MEGGGVSFWPVEECTAVLPPLLVSPQSPAPHPHGHLDSGTGAHRLNTTSNSWQDSRASPFLASPAFTGPLSGAAGLACWPLRPLSGVICAGQGPGPGQAAATSLRWGQASLILSWRSWPSPLPVGTRGREMKLQAKQSSERSMVSVSCGKKKTKLPTENKYGMLWEYEGRSWLLCHWVRTRSGQFSCKSLFLFSLRYCGPWAALCSVAKPCPNSLGHEVPPWTSLSPTGSWNYPDKNTGLSCHFLLQGIFLTRDRALISCI